MYSLSLSSRGYLFPTRRRARSAEYSPNSNRTGNLTHWRDKGTCGRSSHYSVTMTTQNSLPIQMHFNHITHQLRSRGPVSRKSRELFGPEKPFVKLRPAYSVKLVFSYVVKGIKIKITAKFRVSRRLSFEDTKRIMSPEMRPKCFGTLEKQAPGFESPFRPFSLLLKQGKNAMIKFIYYHLDSCAS